MSAVILLPDANSDGCYQIAIKNNHCMNASVDNYYLIILKKGII